MSSDESGYRGAAYYSSEKAKKEYRPPEERENKDYEETGDRKDVEEEIKEARAAKRTAESRHDVTILRQRAAEDAAKAARYYGKYRAEEAAEVKFTQNAAKARRKAESLIQKSKEMETKAADLQAMQGGLSGKKLEKNKVKVAKFKQRAAKLISKSSSNTARAAKYDQKALAKRTKAKEYLEKSKIHEAESKGYNERADRLEKISE